MKKILLNATLTVVSAIIGVSASVFASAPARAAEVSVHWQEPDKFTDIRSGNEAAPVFQSRMIKEFDAVFADLAKKMPAHYQWDIVVSDVDLAGELRPSHSRMGREVRIVKGLDWPRISLSYTLKNTTNAVVISGKEQINDMNFMAHSDIRSGASRFYYEEKMLRDWFFRQQRDKIFPER